MSELVCWHCGASLAALPLPLSRRDQCGSCGADVHVCRLCAFYDATRSKACREPVVEEVRDKEKANFCDYFTPRADAHDAQAAQRGERARQELEALFGGAEKAESAGDQQRSLDELFGGGKD